MEKAVADPGVSFGPYRVDPEQAQLWRGVQEVRLTGKAFAVLRYFIAHPGQLVTKDDLFEAVWPRTVVSESTLASCIQELRHALRDDAKEPHYIETVHRRGYRFIGKVVSRQYSVVSKRRAENDSQLATGNWQLTTPLVGREAELAHLQGYLEKALGGERQVVFVTGEAGIGKTALVEAFLAGLGQRGMGNGEQARQKAKGKRQKPALSGVEGAKVPDLRPPFPDPWLSWGQCIEHYGAGEPYLPVLEALGRLCREQDGRQLIELLAQHAPTWLVQLPALLTAAELESLQRKTAGTTKERMLRELTEALEVLTAERPLVLWLEDLHWCDPSTLDWLAFVARRRERARLLVLGSYRPVDVIVSAHPLKTVKQDLQLHRQCTELALGALSEAAVGEYMAVRFTAGAQRAVPLESVAQAIHRRTDGNPLFMVNVVEQLFTSGTTTAAGEGEQTTAWLATIEHTVPENLRELIEQQFERLTREDRRVLEAASVARLEFSAAAVAAGVETGVEGIEEQCGELARRGQFVQAVGVAEWPDGTVAGQYRFLHALYQEVIHARLSEGRRRTLHRRIGERKEQGYGERAREIAAELAVHFEQARDYRRAIQYLQQAGTNALERSAHQEAISLLTRGLELLKTLPDTSERTQQELRLQLALGGPLIVTKGYTALEVERVYTRARELCRQLGETPELFWALAGLYAFYVIQAELKMAREMAEQGLRLAQNLHNLNCLKWAHFELGEILCWLGEFTLAREHVEAGIASYDFQQYRSYSAPEDSKVSCLSSAAPVLWCLGFPNQALQRCHETLTLAQELSHPYSLVVALDLAVRLHQLRREVQLARESAEAVIALSTEQGFPHWLVLGTIWRGWALAEQGQVEEGIIQIRQGLAARRAKGAEGRRPYFLAQLAAAYGKGGQVEEGLTVLAEALAIMNKTGERFYEAELYRLKGQLTLQKESQTAKGKRQKPALSGVEGAKIETDPRFLMPDAQGEAEACFLKAIEIARKQQAKSLELRAATSLARLWQQQGKHHAARNTLSEIYNWFTEGFDTVDLKEAKMLIDELSR